MARKYSITFLEKRKEFIMAFAGTPVATSLGKNMTLINGSGLGLAAGASGTIKTSGGDINLPSGQTLDANTLVFVFSSDGQHLIDITKAADTITITNSDGANALVIEQIFVLHPHSLIR